MAPAYPPFRLWWTVFFCLGCFHRLTAQAIAPAELQQDFMVRSWNKGTGLPHDRVKSLLQTRDGYLWIGTSTGLARFDGVKFELFTRGSRVDLTNDDILALAEDTDGRLWLGTGGGLFCWDGHRFTRLHQQDRILEESIGPILLARDGDIWVGAMRSVQRFPTGSRQPDSPRYGGFEIFAFCEGLDGSLWVGSDSLLRLNPLTQRLDSLGLPPEIASAHVMGLLPLPDSGVLVLARTLEKHPVARIATFRGSRWESIEPPATDNAGRWEWWLRDRRGFVWLGNGAKGLATWKDGQFQNFGAPWAAPEDHAVCGLEDREGNIWIGTEGSGLFCLTPKRVAVIDQHKGLAHDQVRTIWPAATGGVWATTAGGLSRIGSDLHSVTNWTRAGDQPFDRLTALAEAPDGALWVGSGRQHFIRRGDGEFTWHRFTPPLPVKASDPQWIGWNKVRSILPAQNHDVWIAVPHGLHRLRHGQDRWFTVADGLGNDDVRALLETRDGTIWAGTAGGGLSRFTGDTNRPFATLTRRDGLSRDTVWSLTEDEHGVLWAGTDGGLNRIERGKIVVFDRRHGLPADGVNCLLTDDFGYLWVGHDQGLYRVSLSDLRDVASGKSRQVSCDRFTENEGLPIAETNGQTATPAACKTADGRLWFATPKGIVVIDPRTLRENAVPPAVVIERVIADQTVIHHNGPESVEPIHSQASGSKSGHRLAPGHARFLEFHYTANTFVASETTRFRYRLEGYEAAWHEAGTRRLAQYIGLPPGPYRLRVVAANHQDVWNETGATFAFTLEPFFYQTGWFWVTSVTGFLGLTVAFGIWRFNVAQRAASLRERGRLTRALHDHLGADLATLQSLAEMARREIPAEHTANQHLKRLSQTATETSRTLRDTIFTLGSGDTSLDGLCARLSQFAGDLLTPRNVRCRFEWPIPLPNLPLHPACSFELYLGVKEALVNVARHANARNCLLRLDLTSEDLVLIVSDDGQGLTSSRKTGGNTASPSDQRLQEPAEIHGGRLVPPEPLSVHAPTISGYGLPNLRAHAANLGGRCDVLSSAGTGVTVRFQIPLGSLSQEPKPRHYG